ncbi:OpgC domain-containing protein [Candidatus Saccharibacteria bacterium]|nr:OpgC domain-containing protein [Candidatus Saccharibacteria bacterium]
MSHEVVKKQNRLETLDHLRGFFIIVIIVDHLSRFPSLFALISGKGLLWVTAAEGFVSISGLLVGYVRGYKNRNEPFQQVAIKLLRRAGILYLWSIIASITYVAIIWYVPLKGGFTSTPMPAGDWKEFLTQLITMQYTYVWVHFLTLYAIFLAAAPIAIWLFRRNLAWVVGVISFALLAIGWSTESEVLQWQFLFFIPSIIGFYLQSILNWWHQSKQSTHIIIAATTVTLTIATIITSIIYTYYDGTFEAMADSVSDGIFAKDSISLARAGLAFLWFTGYIFIFYALRKIIKKTLNWLLIPIGTHSLTAYILHGLALCVVSYYTIGGDNFWINTLLGIIAILITWVLLKIPAIRRVIPA